MKLEFVVLPVADVGRAVDLDWPDWYAAHVVAEQAGRALPI